MRRSLFASALLAISLPAAAQAPFCAVTSMGAQCNFYSHSACWQAVRGVGGQCVANPAALPAQQLNQPAPIAPIPRPATVQQPNVMGSFMAGMAAGQAQRAAREQTADPWEAVNQHMEDTCRLCPPPKAAYKVVYSCPNDSGGSYRSETALVGCVVADIEF